MDSAKGLGGPKQRGMRPEEKSKREARKFLTGKIIFLTETHEFPY